MAVDYSLYLVTDSTPQILGSASLVDVVDAAIRGGVTVVQYRDKHSDTGVLVETAKRLHAVTRRHGVPLLVNDRVDVALAVGCEGVHLGQDDMALAQARRILGDKALIGVTASSAEEAIAAADGGADYLGLGTVFATATKENAKSIIGTAGLRTILGALAAHGCAVPTVCIGGINADTVQRVMFQSRHAHKALDGVAVVSAIVAARDARAAAETLRRRLVEPPPFASGAVAAEARGAEAAGAESAGAEAAGAESAGAEAVQKGVKGDKGDRADNTNLEQLLSQVGPLAQRLAQQKPLCHNMTNLVVQNFAANVALAIGGSPIMSSNGHEAPELAALGGSLVINMGTATPEALDNYRRALQAYNASGNPVLLDPVGGGATSIRRSAVAALMAAGYFDVIKGNESEIRSVLGEDGYGGGGGGGGGGGSGTQQPQQQQRGVDSAIDSGLSGDDRARLVQRLAQRERSIVLMTGATDYLSDGRRTFAVDNGVALLGDITGSGCTLGSTVAAFAAVERDDKLLACLAALLLFEIAAEQAARRADVKGTGTFAAALVDELYGLRCQSAAGDHAWTAAARVRQLDMRPVALLTQ